MRIARFLAFTFLFACSSKKPAVEPVEGPPAMHPTGAMSEADFKALHELRADHSPAASGEMIDLAGGRAYLSLPEGATGPVPGIIVIHEWWGLNEHIEHWADRLAGLGYAALAIDLYKGEVATDADAAMATMQKVQEADAKATIDAAVQFLQTDPRVQAPKLAVIGWCFGGGWSLEAALDHPEIDAAVMYYGMPETDVARLKEMHAKLLGIFANQDGHITPQVVDDFEKALGEAGADAHLYRYDADHAFANPSGAHYDENDAADAWEKVITFLQQTISAT